MMTSFICIVTHVFFTMMNYVTILTSLERNLKKLTCFIKHLIACFKLKNKPNIFCPNDFVCVNLRSILAVAIDCVHAIPFLYAIRVSTPIAIKTKKHNL